MVLNSTMIVYTGTASNHKKSQHSTEIRGIILILLTVETATEIPYPSVYLPFGVKTYPIYLPI